MMEMSAVKRVETAINLGIPDRVPLEFADRSGWENLSIDENYAIQRDAQKLAEREVKIRQCGNYRSDEAPLSYANNAIVEAWGAKLNYSLAVPGINSYLVEKTEDYGKLRVLDPYKDGRLPVLVEQLELISRMVGNDMFLWAQEFSPLGFLFHMSEATQAVVDMVLHPELVKEALETITETIIKLVKAFAGAGANGLRLNCQRWDRAFFSEDYIKEFDMPYVIRILGEAKKLGLLTKMFVELPNPYLDLILRLPGLNCFEFLDTAPRIRTNELPKKWAFENLDEEDLKGLREKLRGKLCLTMPVAGRPLLMEGQLGKIEKDVKRWLKTMAVGGGLTMGMFGSAGGSWGNRESLLKVAETVHKYGTYPINVEES